MGNDCTQEGRLKDLEIHAAVTKEQVTTIKEVVSDMRKYLIGFMISVLLLFGGSLIKDHFTITSVVAETQKGDVCNGR